MKKQFGYAFAGLLLLALGFGMWQRRQDSSSIQMKFEELSQDDVYEKLARETGGQVWNLDKTPEQMGKIADLVSQSQIENDKYVFLLIAEGKISEGTAEFTFQVDSSLRSLAVYASGLKSRPEIEVFNSDLQKQEPSRILESKQGATFLFGSPKPGEWRLKIRSTDNVWIQVKGESDIAILNAGPVRLGGRSGHQGYFPYKGSLESGSQEKISAEISNQHQETKIEISLISLDGRVLSKGRVLSDMRIPSEAFRVRIEWEDPNGLKGQRLEEKIFHLGKLEMVRFETKTKEANDSELCRVLQSSSHWSILTESKTGSSASILCLIEATATEQVLYSKLMFLVPWNAKEEVTEIQLFSANYQKLNKADCESADKIFSKTPQDLSDSFGRKVRHQFSCKGGPSEFEGVLNVQVLNPPKSTQ